MPGLLTECKELFGDDNLYEVLGIKKTANDKQVKRAYHTLSLKVHPDRVEEADKENATKKFQTLGKVYSIMSNKESRKVYDETGEVDDEESSLSEDKDWEQYWRLLFPKISVSDIKKFEKTYKGSDEELQDLKAAYVSCKGDMDEILDTVMCSDQDDIPRFKKIIKAAIKAGELKSYKAFDKEDKEKKAARKRKAQFEAAEANKAREEMGLGEGMAGLQAMIQRRNKDRKKEADSFLEGLAAKYGGMDDDDDLI